MLYFLDTRLHVFSNVNVSETGAFPSGLESWPCARSWSRPRAAQGHERPLRKAAPTCVRGAARRHLPWLWRRRARRSAEGTGPLPPAPPGRPCAAPSPRAADTKRERQRARGWGWGTTQRAFARSSAPRQAFNRSTKMHKHSLFFSLEKEFCIFPIFIRIKQT